MSRRSGRSKVYIESSELTSGFAEDYEINNYEAEAEDENEEEQEITRCICGQEELNTQTINQQLINLLLYEYQIKIDQGLFIQCDKCSVWQHGYCVGLFINEDVPDKYWCELCKPDLHVFIYENNESIRTLYKPVNDKRKKLSLEHLSNDQASKSGRQRSKRQTTTNINTGELKATRKERRHYDDSYDEQLQKALRESARESGVVIENESKRNSNKRKLKSDDSDESSKKTRANENERHDEESNDQDPSNLEDDNDDIEENKPKPKHDAKRTKPKSKNSKSKSKSNKSSSSNNDSSNSLSNPPPLTKDELINQPSKPRYVNEKSSIYELRKRTGAILEWLGRSQLELEEEKSNKIELFSYKEKPDVDQQKIDEENNKVIHIFNENLRLMEILTEKILNWEQKFGKYAP